MFFWNDQQDIRTGRLSYLSTVSALYPERNGMDPRAEAGGVRADGNRRKGATPLDSDRLRHIKDETLGLGDLNKQADVVFRTPVEVKIESAIVFVKTVVRRDGHDRSATLPC